MVAYVMWSQKMSLRDAVRLVHKARPALRINVAFLSQLQAFEQDLLKDRLASVSLEQLDAMDVCKCSWAIKDPSAGVARGKRNCPPWKPKK